MSQDEAEEKELSLRAQAPPSNSFDLALSLGFIIFSGVFLYFSGNFADISVSESDPGAALWPRAALSVMVIAALVNIVIIYRRVNDSDETLMVSGADIRESLDFTPQQWQYGASVVLMAVYFASQEYLGFFVSTPIFLFFFAWFIGYKSIVKLATFSIGISMIIFFGFRVYLQVALPFGSGPFREITIWATNLF